MQATATAKAPHSEPRADNPDLIVIDHFSTMTLRSRTDAGRDFVNECLKSGGAGFGGSVAIEPRYLDDMIFDAESQGLMVHIGPLLRPVLN